MTGLALRQATINHMQEMVQYGWTPPRFHGNGFVQFYLNKTKRLHIWTSALPPLVNHNATIHDHTFDMHSDVLLGGIKHTTYGHSQVHHGSPWHTHDMFDLYLPEGETKTRPSSHHVPVAVDQTGGYFMREGCGYFFGRCLFHETDRDEDFGMAATLMTKVVQNGDPKFPRVIASRGETPMDAFGPTAPKLELLWQAIEDAVRLMPIVNILKLDQAMADAVH